MPTPNVCLDIWDCVESYVMHMFLACGLKIIFTSSCKLILSFWCNYNTIFSSLLIVTSSPVRVGMPLPLLLCCISSLGQKGLLHEPLPREPFNTRTHFVFMTIIVISKLLLSNQLGRFPITSDRGNKYIVIFYIYNANFVKSIPIESRSPVGIPVGLCLPHHTGLQTTTS